MWLYSMPCEKSRDRYGQVERMKMAVLEGGKTLDTAEQC